MWKALVVILGGVLLLVGIKVLLEKTIAWLGRRDKKLAEEQAELENLRVYKANHAQFLERLKALFSKIDFETDDYDYQGLPFAEAYQHACAIVEGVERIYTELHDAGFTAGSLVPWSSEDKQIWIGVFSGLLTWGSRQIVVNCICDRLFARGVDDRLSIEDAYEQYEQIMPPDFSKITVAEYYNV